MPASTPKQSNIFMGSNKEEEKSKRTIQSTKPVLMIEDYTILCLFVELNLVSYNEVALENK